MKFVIVTGLSGAGKSQTLKRLEDLGYFCVDNLPPDLIPKFAEICLKGHREKAAAAVDMRMGEMFPGIFDAIEKLKKMTDISLDILFLDATDEVIVKRFKETRRKHPLSQTGQVMEGIKEERRMLTNIEQYATNRLDTSVFSLKQLGDALDAIYSDSDDQRILISITTFGQKRGIPIDADMVFDMRFLPNPFYVPELKALTGKDEPVRKYVFAAEQANQFVDRIVDMINLVTPFYLKQDKKQLVVAIGCTGGKHRSVAVGEAIYQRLSAEEMRVTLNHRDIGLE